MRTPMRIMQNLGTLPSSVHEAYRRLLDRTTDKDSVSKILSWIYHAKRPLSMGELREAIVVEPEDKTLKRDILPSPDMVIECCEGLVVWEPTNFWEADTVRFLHSSVRTFMDKEKPRILLPLKDITRVCLTYLSFDDFESTIGPDSQQEWFGFRVFAATNWHSYMKGEVEGDVQVQTDFLRLVTSQTKRESMLSIIDKKRGLYHRPNRTVLHIIAQFGLNSVYQSLLADEEGSLSSFKNKLSELERDKLAMLVEEIQDVSAKDDEGWTPLHYAAEMGNTEFIPLLLSNGANIEEVDNKGRTALHHAMESLETMKVLVRHGADINAKDNMGSTALHWAARSSYTWEMVKWMVELGADVNARDNDGSTALLSAAARFGKRDTLKWLVEPGADVNARDNEGRTVLHRSSHTWEMVKWLVKLGADVNAKDNEGRTVLHRFSHITEMVKWLVKLGADVNAKDNDGRTALHSAAATFDNMLTLIWLVKLGADVNARDNDGRTALHLAAATFDNMDTLKWLVKLGADVNARNNEGRTVLHLAVSLAKDNNKEWEVAKLLVEHGADVNAGVDGEGTVLGYVASFTEDDKDWEMVKWLVEHGADVTEKNFRGWTLLHSAVSQDNLEAVKWLVQCGMDVNIKNNDGFTALRYTEDLEVRNWLVDHGAVDSE